MRPRATLCLILLISKVCGQYLKSCFFFLTWDILTNPHEIECEYCYTEKCRLGTRQSQKYACKAKSVRSLKCLTLAMKVLTVNYNPNGGVIGPHRFGILCVEMRHCRHSRITGNGGQFNKGNRNCHAGQRRAAAFI